MHGRLRRKRGAEGVGFLLELPTRGRSGVEVGAQCVAGLDRGGQLITQGSDAGAQRVGILRERFVP